MKIQISTSAATQESWDKMNNAKRRAYLAKHPNSKYGKKAGAAPKAGGENPKKTSIKNLIEEKKEELEDLEKKMGQAKEKISSCESTLAKSKKALKAARVDALEDEDDDDFLADAQEAVHDYSEDVRVAMGEMKDLQSEMKMTKSIISKFSKQLKGLK